MNKRRTLVFLLALVAVLALCSISAYAAGSDITVTIDGEYVHFDESLGKPYITNGRTMVPLRAVMESLGCNVKWNGEDRSVTVSKYNSDTVVRLFIGSNTAYVNGNMQYVDVPPVIQNGRTYLPIRFVLEAYGAAVYWGSNTRNIYVYSEGPNHPWSYEWENSYGNQPGDTVRLTLNFDNKVYSQCLENAITSPADLKNYIIGAERLTYGKEYIQKIINAFDDYAAQKGMTDAQEVEMMIAFVQSFDYKKDIDTTAGQFWEYVKYPSQTLYDKSGDCEDTALLLYSLLQNKGYDSAMLIFKNVNGQEGHAATGLHAEGMTVGQYLFGTEPEYEQYKYFYVETTGKGWRIGEIPENVQNMDAKITMIIDTFSTADKVYIPD